MLNLVPYIFKLSISLCVVYLFYQVFLRRLTFYSWNRWYLLLYSMVCFVIPFVNIFQLFSEPALQQSPIVQYIPAIEEITVTQTRASISSGAFSMNLMYLIIVFAGILFMLIRCLIQFYSLFRIHTKAKLLYNNTVKLYHIDKPIIPFSFGNAIYINQHQHNQQELSEIIRHEFIHVKQRHTVDMIWSELLCILNWYNPFAWLLRKAIRQNLEFIADHQVLQSGLDRKQYQYLLLKVIGTAEFSIANNFNFSSLKKRIAMMNKTKSARVNLLRFAFILPLLAVILLAFRNVVQQKPQPWSPPVSSGKVTIDTALYIADTVPARKAYTMPDNVRNLDVEYTGTKHGRVTVTLKNGEVEKYDLSKEKERKAFEDKYGALPEPPVPPKPVEVAEGVHIEVPAVPETPPVAVDIAAPAAPGVPPVKPAAPTAVKEHPGVITAPEPRPYHANSDNCFTKKGYCITVADNQGECVVIVKNKELKIIEAVALTDWNKNKQYSEKYGDIPFVLILKGKPAAPSKPVPVVNLRKVEGISMKGVVNDTAALTGRSVPAAVAEEVKSRIDAHVPAGANKIEMVIDKNTTKEDLEQFDKKLHEHSCSLVITNIRFENGYLKNIDGTIGSNDGRRKATFSSDDLTESSGKILIVSSKGEKDQNYLSVNTRPTL